MGEFINPKILEMFLRQPELTKEKRNLSGDENDMNMYLYKYDVECDYFIIILDGNALVQVGKEGMEINAGLFSYYGVNALLNDDEKDPLECISRPDTERRPYKPEFSLKVNSYCVYLQIKRKEWKDAVKKSIIERTYAPLVTPGAALSRSGTKSPLQPLPPPPPLVPPPFSIIQTDINNNSTETTGSSATPFNSALNV
jgi:hypothetical protein